MHAHEKYVKDEAEMINASRHCLHGPCFEANFRYSVISLRRMKPATEMHEGTEALTRFEDTMKRLFSAKKNATLNPFGKSGKKRKKPEAPKG